MTSFVNAEETRVNFFYTHKQFRNFWLLRTFTILEFFFFCVRDSSPYLRLLVDLD